MNRRDAILAAGATLLLAGCGRDIPTSKKRPPFITWTRVTGVSMKPTFPEECFVETQVGYPYEDLKEGDTVIFWDYFRGSGMTHHRLVAKQGGNWIAQGDNPVTNAVADRPWVTPDNYVARTTGKYSVFLII